MDLYVWLQLDEDLQRARCIIVDSEASSLLPGHAQGYFSPHLEYLFIFFVHVMWFVLSIGIQLV